MSGPSRAYASALGRGMDIGPLDRRPGPLVVPVIRSSRGLGFFIGRWLCISDRHGHFRRLLYTPIAFLEDPFSVASLLR